jgi:sporulation protein YlmC with PRC-barrel domain
MAQAGSSGSGNFVTQVQQGQWTASKLIGTKVVSANNENIGDVNDVILDRNGTAQAVVIGVGGFLGIGEKNVAVPFQSLEFASSRDTSTTASTTGSGTATSGSASAGTAGGDVDRVVLRMTKAELEAAPKFERGGSSGSSAARPSGSSSGATGSGATR